MALVECVPNFSEGSDLSIVDELARAADGQLIHRTSDADHNRSVLTLAGEPEEILETAVRLAREAVHLIDLRRHSGVHPRIGALDVLPFIPLADADMALCVNLAHRAGERIWDELGIPVYFYEYASRREACRNLADVRKLLVPPDLGDKPHPSAGCMAIGARKILIAYNVNLNSPDVDAAKAIASKIREANGGLPAVKALGLKLASRGRAQVSMNLVDYEQTPPHVAYLAIEREARARGIRIASSELIGLIPQKALDGAAAAGVDLKWENFRGEAVLENRLKGLNRGPISSIGENQMQVAEPARKTTEHLRRQALGSVAKLPPFSAVMNKLMATLANEDVSFGDVATVIEQDTVLAGNVLKVVNSAAYGRRGTVNSVRHAVTLLGLSRVRNTAMTISVGQMWGRLDLHPQWSPKQFHLHSMAAATLADLLVMEVPVNYPEGAFTGGLLSGVGLLLMATALRQEYTQLNRCYALASENGSGSLDACELALFGFPHAELSADILEHWGLPEPMATAVRCASQPFDAPLTKLSEILHLSTILAAQTGYSIQSWVRPPVGDPQSTLVQHGLGPKAEVLLANYGAQMQVMQPFVA